MVSSPRNVATLTRDRSSKPAGGGPSRSVVSTRFNAQHVQQRRVADDVVRAADVSVHSSSARAATLSIDTPLNQPLTGLRPSSVRSVRTWMP